MTIVASRGQLLPNGSPLSCRRNGRGRKVGKRSGWLRSMSSSGFTCRLRRKSVEIMRVRSNDSLDYPCSLPTTAISKHLVPIRVPAVVWTVEEEVGYSPPRWNSHTASGEHIGERRRVRVRILIGRTVQRINNTGTTIQEIDRHHKPLSHPEVLHHDGRRREGVQEHSVEHRGLDVNGVVVRYRYGVVHRVVYRKAERVGLHDGWSGYCLVATRPSAHHNCCAHRKKR